MVKSEMELASNTSAGIEIICPLCLGFVERSLLGPLNYQLWHCNNCELVFKDEKHWPSQQAEKERYLEHNNEETQGYIDFLKQALSPALQFFEPGMEGLDFGCGPNPVLSKMIQEAGFECFNYDPIFFPEFPDERMDFIFATESFEHFFNPYQELKLITALLRPGGLLTIMTHRWKEKEKLSDWWYLRDKTHVTFYHRKTFDYICSEFGYSVLFDDGEKVLVLEKDVVREK